MTSAFSALCLYLWIFQLETSHAPWTPVTENGRILQYRPVGDWNPDVMDNGGRALGSENVRDFQELENLAGFYAFRHCENL